MCLEYETGKERWAKREHELRSKWENLHSTTRNEVQVAIHITKTCFRGARAFDLAILSLSLENREYQGRSKRGKLRRRRTDAQPYNSCTNTVYRNVPVAREKYH